MPDEPKPLTSEELEEALQERNLGNEDDDRIRATLAAKEGEIERLRERIEELREASGESPKNFFVHANAKLDRKNQALKASLRAHRGDLCEIDCSCYTLTGGDDA